MVSLRERLHAILWHAAAEELPSERADTALAARLVSEETPAEAGRQAGEKLQKYYGQPVPAVRHQSSPLWPFPTAFAIIPPMLREDMYCSVSRKACSSGIPPSFTGL